MSFEVFKLHFCRASIPISILIALTVFSAPSQAKVKASFDQRYAEAERFRLSNDYANALNRYTALCKVRPADSRMHANKGWVLVMIGNMKEAKEEIDKAMILNDEDPYAHQALAVYYMRLGDKKNARQEYIKTIALDPKRNCHCGGIQKYLGITSGDEKKAIKEAAQHGRLPAPAKRH